MATNLYDLGKAYASPFLIGASSFMGGMAKRRAMKESSESEYDNAIASKVRGYFQERGMRLEQDSLLSQIQNVAAGKNLDTTQGSPLDAYLQAARETQLDVLHARHNAEQEVSMHMKKAAQLARGADSALYGELLGGAKGIMKWKNDLDSVSFKK